MRCPVIELNRKLETFYWFNIPFISGVLYNLPRNPGLAAIQHMLFFFARFTKMTRKKINYIASLENGTYGFQSYEDGVLSRTGQKVGTRINPVPCYVPYILFVLFYLCWRPVILCCLQQSASRRLGLFWNFKMLKAK